MTDRSAFSTRAARSGRGRPPDQWSRSLTAPLYQSTVWAFDDLERLDAVNAGAEGSVYYRYGTPNGAVLEEAVGELESAEAAVSAASGMAVVTAAVLAVARQGDHVVADRHAYGGTYTLLTEELPRLGITARLVDATDHDEVGQALAGGARALLIEALSNPNVRVTDVPALCALGREHGVPVIVDATFVSPALLRPVEHGAALSWHSLAKYLGGHSAAMGGVAAGDRALVEAIRTKVIHLGGSLGAMDAWVATLGLATLPLRMRAHSDTARAVAEHLATHPAVAAVRHPALAHHPQHELAGRLYPEGTGGMLAFDLAGGEPAARAFLADAAPIAFAPSLADVATTVSYPLATSHRGLPDEALADLQVGPGLIRLSAGIEDPADVIADLDRALAPRGSRVCSVRTDR